LELSEGIRYTRPDAVRRASGGEQGAGLGMKFFVDSADVAEIRELADTGLVDGVTTNPSLVAKSGRDFIEVLREICALVAGPVSAEVTATAADAMIVEGRKLAAVASNVAVKVPLTWDGLKACRALSQAGTRVNVTLCFSAAQAILAAKAGAAFVSPFVGRLDDIGHDGMALIRDIVTIYRNYEDTLTTEVLVASIRHPMHVVEAAKAGADVCTIPPAVLRQLVKHVLTDKGLDAFLADWKKTGQSIVAG
jgi:transaldolase